MTPLSTPKPSTEAMLTMLPPLFAASMRRAASCAQKNTASRSVESTRRHSSSASSTARGVRDAGIVDEDRHRAEGLLGGVEGAGRGMPVAYIGGYGDCLSTGFGDLRLQRGEPLGAPRHQHDRRAVVRQHLGEVRAKPAGRAGHQRDLAVKIEKLCGGHDLS